MSVAVRNILQKEACDRQYKLREKSKQVEKANKKTSPVVWNSLQFGFKKKKVWARKSIIILEIDLIFRLMAVSEPLFRASGPLDKWTLGRLQFSKLKIRIWLRYY